jgi:acyl carrier protein
MVDEENIKQVMALMLKIDISKINDKSSMDNILNWDSLRHMNLILALEDEFKISIPDEDVGNITSFKLIKLVLEEQLLAKGK